MRLIDADALVAQEEFFAKTFKGDFGEQVANHVIEVINYAPTVDAIPIEYIRETSKWWAKDGYEDSAEAIDILVNNWYEEGKKND